uniref:Group XIIA secretory phospholipase A2like [Megachile rotundata] n=2 Tax=Lepeophtheirus salmonis TaxID=72036 RepID=A0A0K2TTF9_LEPSM
MKLNDVRSLSKLFIIIVLLLCPCVIANTWYGDIIDSAKELFKGSNIIDGALKGLRYVEMVDSALAEDCAFECPYPNQTPVPKRHHQPTSNGCGSFGYLFPPENNDNWIYVEREFSACCDRHDHCYDTCNEDKDDCDLVFKRCLYSVCKSKDILLAKKTCQAKAKMFYLAVIGLGCQSYKEAQKEACNCVKKYKEEL